MTSLHFFYSSHFTLHTLDRSACVISHALIWENHIWNTACSITLHHITQWPVTIYHNSGKIPSLCSWRDYYARYTFLAAVWALKDFSWTVNCCQSYCGSPARVIWPATEATKSPQKSYRSGVCLKPPLSDIYLRKGYFTFAYLAGFLKTLPQKLSESRQNIN